MSNKESKHSVFVLSKTGKPLTPTTPSRARKLLKAKVAKPVWSKFQTFGIQMLEDTREETPATTLGYDVGTKFEGFAVVVGQENNLSIKLDLPDKKKISRKITERATLRRCRRRRNCRRRPARFSNRRNKNFINPSQRVIINSRLKVLREFFKLYPIKFVAFENVKFSPRTRRAFPDIDIETATVGKTKIRQFIESQEARLFEYLGVETAELRKKYGYEKTQNKRENVFTSHCSDALAIAVDVSVGHYIEPGRFLICDDTYRPVRRKLHDTQPAKGGKRDFFTKGTVRGLRKGLLICSSTGVIGRLCGDRAGNFRFYDLKDKRLVAKSLKWVSSQFVMKAA